MIPALRLGYSYSYDVTRRATELNDPVTYTEHDLRACVEAPILAGLRAVRPLLCVV